MKIATLSQKDQQLPLLLREIPGAPQQLYVLGQLPTSEQICLAVVGSRKPSGYGIEATKRIVGDLARAGLVIISGLALGIDSIAHQAALEAGGQTVAVMPCGLDRVYPASHRQLALQILQKGGALVSEYPEGMPPQKHHFLARNRIVSGMSAGVLVIEATERSGTLSTVNFALEQGRTVTCVPGNITSLLSAGTNNLIKNGANPITSAEDVLLALGFTPRTESKALPRADNPVEHKVLSLIASGVSDGEALQAQSEIAVAEFLSTISLLEVTGRVRNLGANQWVIR